MAGDISRSSFSPGKHFSGVRMQQGRVQTDADWNEQVDLASHYTRTALLDQIGPYGAPVGNAGFGISALGTGLAISPGRMYVNGILCENPQTVSVTAGSAPGVPGQPDLPNYVLPTTPGLYSIYLDVWERDITALEDPSILEIALGGVDTTTRTRIVWQVKWNSFLGSCVPNFASAFPPSTGQMEAQAQPSSNAATPCAMPAQAGYSSLENQLYRVEIHTGGAAGVATLKWSRDNASVVAGWISSPASGQIVVSTLGKDQTLSFQGGDWVELTDDTHELTGTPGTLVQLSNAEMIGLSPTLTLNLATASGSTSALSFPQNPKVRRWDQVATGTVTLTGGAVSLLEGSWLPLENGVQVQFTPGGDYNTGDYWLIPARTATAMSSPTIVWPADTNGNPLAQPALGIQHSYAPLATVNLDATTGWSLISDCRLFFSPPTLPGAMHVVSTSFIQPAGPLVNDSLVPLGTFLNGFKITCDRALDPATIKLPTFPVMIDTPTYAYTSAITGLYPAAIPVKLMANYAVGDNGNISAFWVPTPVTRASILETMATFGAQTMNNGQALVSVTLKGNFVSAQGAPSTQLNGPAYGAEQNGSITLNLPSGDGQRGGDFECWFWVPGYCDPTYPANYVPFTSIFSITGPDLSGDYVVVGEMPPDGWSILQSLALPDTLARKIYCQPVEIAPGLVVIAYVPTAAERTGDFSTFLLPLVDPTNAGGAQFPGNIIPVKEQPFSPFLSRQAVEEHAAIPTPGPIRAPVPVPNPVTFAYAGVFAWRIRGIYKAPVHYGYGYGYGYASGVGAELI